MFFDAPLYHTVCGLTKASKKERMIRMKAWKVLGLSLVVSLMGMMGTEAVNWKCVYHKEDTAITEYVDMDSIQKDDYDTRSVWIRYEENTKSNTYLVAFRVNGEVKLVSKGTADELEIAPVPEDWSYAEPDSPLYAVYEKVWPKKERKVKSRHEPNKWERKGEDTVDRAVNHAIDRIMWRWGY